MSYIKKKYSIRRIKTKFLFQIARRCPFIPGKIRALLYFWGGVNFLDYKSNFIGYDVLFDDLNPQLITIGKNTFITEGSKILTHYVDVKFDDFHHHQTGNVSIGDNVFLGLNTIITKPVTIGEGSVVGSGSVITKDIPPRSIVAGNPAIVIKRREINE